jgi:hypothetical protein
MSLGRQVGNSRMNMPHSRKWQRLLAETHGRSEAARIMTESRVNYRQLVSADPPISVRNHSVKQNLTMRIYPGLAVYKTLLDINPDQSWAMATVETLIKDDFFGIMLNGIRLLNHLPDPFPVIKPALKMMTRTEYLPGSQEVIEDSRDCFAMNIYRCSTLDALMAYNAPELTRVYCKTDDWLSEAMPKVGWLRTKTLGQGDSLCDFRWCRCF